jgi:hypothetical protein
MVWVSAFTMVIRCEPAGRATAVGLVADFVAVLADVLAEDDPDVPGVLARAGVDADVADVPDG